jgi:hypothetical protein
MSKTKILQADSSLAGASLLPFPFLNGQVLCRKCEDFRPDIWPAMRDLLGGNELRWEFWKMKAQRRTLAVPLLETEVCVSWSEGSVPLQKRTRRKALQKNWKLPPTARSYWYPMVNARLSH